MPARPALPRILVLLATYNGSRWLGEQLASIAMQEGVQVRVVASDDGSTDPTQQVLHDFATGHPLQIMPQHPGRFGNANRNFIRLIADADPGEDDYVAFADQDDIWLPSKLHRAAARITADGLDAYSSDVIAFWPDGRQRQLHKAGPPRRFDHLFESAGPGCTFVLPRSRFLELQAWVRANRADVDEARVHDWLIYAYARSHGWRWFIDPQPGLMYRQHGGNEVGANVGARAALRRARTVFDGRFAADVLDIARIAGIESPVLGRLRRLRWTDRLFLAIKVSQFRRRPVERWVLALMFLTMRAPARD